MTSLFAPALVALMATTLFAAASPASAAPAPEAADEHCVVLVGSSENGEASPVLETVCAPSRAQAHSALDALAPHEVSASTLLITLYADPDYRGEATSIYGSAGPCDRAGYELHLNAYWGTRVSSARGTTACNTATFYNRANNYSRTFSLPVGFLGTTLGDNVGKIQVFRR